MKNKMSGNYTGNELSHAMKLHAAVLGVTDLACARNSHFNIPTHMVSITTSNYVISVLQLSLSKFSYSYLRGWANN